MVEELTAAEQIATRHKDRHAHESNPGRCKDCSAFVSKGLPEGGAYRYRCYRCGWVFERVENRAVPA